LKVGSGGSFLHRRETPEALRQTRRPTREELQAAVNGTVPDLIGRGLVVLFCGINPGLYSAATRHHFARPGNRFWRALHAAGFTDRVLAPWEERMLLARGLGITNLVSRATASADELSREELIAGRARLARKAARFRPRWIAIVGIGAYRAAFGRPAATMGRQPDRLGPSGLWVLPNPSGLNANHQVPDLARAFRALRRAAETERR
jgi:TDG/mug DNA glycosylase family protein